MFILKVEKLIKDVGSHDWLRKNDLFLVIELGDQKRRTSTKWNTNEPVWNEVFLFEKEHEEIKFSLYDEDKYGKNELIMTSKRIIKKDKNDEINSRYKESKVCNTRVHYKFIKDNYDIEMKDLNEQLDEAESIMTDIRDKNTDLQEQIENHKKVNESLEILNHDLRNDLFVYNKKYNELYDKVKSFVSSVTHDESDAGTSNVTEC